MRMAVTTLGLLLASACNSATPVTDALRQEIAPSGTLRAAINHGNALLAQRNPVTGEISGIAMDLSVELARRLDLPLEVVPFGSAGQMARAVQDGAWDIAYLAIDPARAEHIDYSDAYLELEGTYLVRGDSPLQTIADVDREGVTIMVTANSAYDLYLSRELRHAQLLRADTTPISIDMMVEQPEIAVIAAVRTALLAATQRIPGSRVMPGHFMTIPQAAGVPKGRPLAARYVHEFIEEMKASGYIADELKKYGRGPDDAIVAGPAGSAKRSSN